MLARCFIDYYFQWHRHGTCCVLHPEQRGTRGTIFICTKIIQCLFYPCFLGRGPIISCIFYLYIFKFLCLSPHNVWQPCLEQTCVFVQKSNKHAGNNIYTISFVRICSIVSEPTPRLSSNIHKSKNWWDIYPYLPDVPSLFLNTDINFQGAGKEMVVIERLVR